MLTLQKSSWANSKKTFGETKYIKGQMQRWIGMVPNLQGPSSLGEWSKKESMRAITNFPILVINIQNKVNEENNKLFKKKV